MKTALTLFHIRRIIMGEADKKALEKKIKEAEKEKKKEERKQLKEAVKKEKVSFLTDFKKFITKGNVLDMAVGVVIGSAFSAIVNGLVKMVINPCIALIPGAESMDNWKTILQPAVLDEAGAVKTAEVAILWGEWIQTIINFFIIAFSIFVVVRVIRKTERLMNAKEIKKQEAEAAAKKAEEDAKAAAAKAAADAKAAEEKAIIDEYYANIREQSQLLRDIKESLKK
jgi:large conductance mechanosensitive channel